MALPSMVHAAMSETLSHDLLRPCQCEGTPVVVVALTGRFVGVQRRVPRGSSWG